MISQTFRRSWTGFSAPAGFRPGKTGPEAFPLGPGQRTAGPRIAFAAGNEDLRPHPP
jgi:hypothetical protein